MTKYVIDAEAKEIYKPLKVQVNGAWVLSPSDDDLARAGIFPIDETKPEKVGVYFIPRGIEKRDGVWHRVYEEQPIVAPPRRIRHFSKLSLYVVLTKLGITDEAFMAWLATKEVEVEGAVIRCDLAFNKAQDLTDNHPAFESIVKDAQTQFGISDEQLEDILAAIEYNPMEV